MKFMKLKSMGYRINAELFSVCKGADIKKSRDISQYFLPVICNEFACYLPC